MFSLNRSTGAEALVGEKDKIGADAVGVRGIEVVLEPSEPAFPVAPGEEVRTLSEELRLP